MKTTKQIGIRIAGSESVILVESATPASGYEDGDIKQVVAKVRLSCGVKTWEGELSAERNVGNTDCFGREVKPGSVNHTCDAQDDYGSYQDFVDAIAGKKNAIAFDDQLWPEIFHA